MWDHDLTRAMWSTDDVLEGMVTNKNMQWLYVFIPILSVVGCRHKAGRQLRPTSYRLWQVSVMKGVELLGSGLTLAMSHGF